MDKSARRARRLNGARHKESTERRLERPDELKAGVLIPAGTALSATDSPGLSICRGNPGPAARARPPRAAARPAFAIEVPGPHELALVRRQRGLMDVGTTGHVAICACGYETKAHKTADAARAAFRWHIKIPWVCLGW